MQTAKIHKRSERTKIVSFSMVKNEVDVIESFIRYHQDILDAMVILDNNSTDGTKEIIEQLIAEGLPIYLLVDSSRDYQQAAKTTQLIHNTWGQVQADVIVPLDADEFIISKKGGNPRVYLEALEDQTLYFFRFFDYMYSDYDIQDELYIPKRILGRLPQPADLLKVAFTSATLEKNRLSVIAGNHDVQLMPGNQVNRQVHEEIYLAHYVFRSREQVKSKVLVGWTNIVAKFNRFANEGSHWRSCFESICHSQDIEVALSDLGMDIERLECLPIDLSYKKDTCLKYTKDNSVNYFKNILDNGLQLAEAYANMMGNFLVLKNRVKQDQRLKEKYLHYVLLEISQEKNIIDNLAELKDYPLEMVKGSIENLGISEENKQRMRRLLDIVKFNE